MSSRMEYRIVMIGHPLQRTALGDAHNEAFTQLGLPIRYERLEVPPVNFHRELTGLLQDPSFIGAKIGSPYKQTVLAYCQELTHAAQGIGAVNTLVRRPTGLIVGDNTDVPAFVRCLDEQQVQRVRTALILGAGGAARVALAGLREMGCARYLIGYRQPRRITEISSQFKNIRRQVTYFAMSDMADFFSWADANAIFSPERLMPAPDPPAPEPRRRGKSGGGQQRRGPVASDDGIKRWNMLVNATPVGLDGESKPLISNISFIRCFEHVLDMIPLREPTVLMELALQAGVPVISGYRLLQLQAECSRELWINEYQRHVNRELPLAIALGNQPRHMTVRRQRR